MQIKARKPKKVVDGVEQPERTAVAEYNLPPLLADKVALLGEEVVNASAEDSIVISVQAFMRRLLEKGKSQEEIQAEVSKYQLTTRNMVRQTAFEKATTTLDRLSPEERAKLLERLQAMQQGAAA
jgi:hypothetical protein